MGGCQQESKANDDVLWAYDAFNAAAFLQASPNPDFSTRAGTWTVGVPKSLYVRDGVSGDPVAGAMIGGMVTNAKGEAKVKFKTPGIFKFKASKQGTI